MSEPAFTPGPWTAGRFTADEVTLVVDGPETVLGEGAVFGPQICTNVFSEADARLIAAAPVLYEALEAVTDLLDDYYAGSQSVAVTNARAALALARGEKP